MSLEKQTNKEQTVIFYHGTSIEKVLCSGGIFTNGLDPNKGGSGNTKLSKTQGSTDYGASSNNKVHFTTDFDTAQSYAENLAGHEDDAVVLSIHVSVEYASQNFMTDVGNTNNQVSFYSQNSDISSFTTTLAFTPDKIFIATKNDKNPGTKMQECEELLQMASAWKNAQQNLLLAQLSTSQEDNKMNEQSLSGNSSTMTKDKTISLSNIIDKIKSSKQFQQTDEDVSGDEWDLPRVNK